MKRFLIPIIVFFALPFSSVESVEINCNSPVHKKKEICKEKLAKNPTFIYLGNEYDSLSSIEEDVSNNDIFEFKNKRYVASKVCPEGLNMVFYPKGRFLRATKVEEIDCMNEDKEQIFHLQMALKRCGGGGGGGGGYDATQYSKQYINWGNFYRNPSTYQYPY